MKTEFSCVRDGLTIRGTEYRRETCLEGSDCYPAAVICHGFGGNQYDLVFYAEKLADMGYAVYCFDFCGGCVVGKSDGDSLDMTIDTEAADLKAVLDYVKKRPYVDVKHMVLIGGSQGGYVAGVVAAERPEDIDKLILFYPALCIPEAARTGTLGGACYDINHVPEVIDTFGVRISRKFHDNVVDKDANEQIRGYKGPVLLIHGSEDMIVNNQYAVQADKAYENCHLQILEGAGHGFTPEQRNEVIVSVLEFLKGHKEILCIRVNITGSEEKRDGKETIRFIYFGGSCENEYFKGTILPGAVDEQHFLGEDMISICAVYELEGRDCSGQDCHIKIINREIGGSFKPQIQTDSPELDFLNDCDLTAALEGFEGGLTVRIFADWENTKTKARG